uniref:Zinc finger, BED-type n=1 Tax=Tanacetum cinerariifolium TaxID=118510 RepID=A0A6L2N1W1_TANCI|nr:zinc finger, BED-type [Tanacetum cinerariifolium]
MNGGRRSWVWDHFTFIKCETRVPCPYCKNVSAAAGIKRNGTSTLIQYLKSVCKKSPTSKKFDLKNQKPIPMGESSERLDSHSFSQEKSAFDRLEVIDPTLKVKLRMMVRRLQRREGRMIELWGLRRKRIGRTLDKFRGPNDGCERYMEEHGEGVNNIVVEIYFADGPEKRVGMYVLRMPISTVASDSSISTSVVELSKILGAPLPLRQLKC